MLKAIRITLLSLICVALVVFMIALINNGFSFKNMKRKLIYNESLELTNIEKINIKSKSSDINIYESDSDQIIIKVYGNEKNKVDVINEEDTLSINLRSKSNVCFGICLGSKIDVYVPSTFEGKFNIDTTSGDINSELSSYNDYVINVTSGDIELNNANSLAGKATSGDVEINKLNSYIDFKTTSGDIEIDEFIVNKNSSIKVTSGDVSIDKCLNAYVEASVKSGDIDINKNDRHAEFELKITTTSGDIEVN